MGVPKGTVERDFMHLFFHESTPCGYRSHILIFFEFGFKLAEILKKLILGLFRACNLTAFTPCLIGSVDYQFASHHEGPRFKSLYG
jgi:hypothetical protein